MHANVDTTLNVYTQVLDGAMRAAVDNVGGELSQLFTHCNQRTSAANEPRDRPAVARSASARSRRSLGGGGSEPAERRGEERLACQPKLTLMKTA